MVTVDTLVTLLTIGTIYALAATSLNLITGYAGLVSIGHAAFIAIGAYAEALLLIKYGVPFLIAFPAACLLGALLGALLGLPSLRVSDDFLAVATIGINFIVVGILKYSDFFGGTLGLGPIPAPEPAGVSLDGEVLLVFTLAMLGLALATTWWLERSWAGLALTALREEPRAAKAVGINTAQFKIIAFTLSGVFAGMAGALYAHYFTFITPNNFGFLVSVDILVFAVVGGLGSLLGPPVGAYVLYLLPEFLRDFQNYRLVMYGLVLVIVLLFEPDGIAGIYDRLKDRALRARTESSAAEGVE
jgi:branched-chain amino acid transport system permease protein